MLSEKRITAIAADCAERIAPLPEVPVSIIKDAIRHALQEAPKHPEAVEHPAQSAKQRYDALRADDNESDPLERLRFFCSLAMNGQDWLDVEPFFDAVKHDIEQPRQVGEHERKAFEAHYRRLNPGATLNRRDMPGSARLGEYTLLSVEDAWHAWQARAALATENEALLRDAQRYRFLRNALTQGLGLTPGRPSIAIPESPDSGDFVNEVDADAAIDIAMQASHAKGDQK